MNLLIVKESDFISPGMIRVEGRRSEHIKCVLRAKEGDLVRTGILGGNTTFAKVVKSERAFAELAVESFDSPPPQKTDIIPIIALPRPQSFKKTLHFIASAESRRHTSSALKKSKKVTGKVPRSSRPPSRKN